MPKYKEAHENCAVLGYYATSSGNFLPTFRDNVSVPSSRVKSPNITTTHCVRRAQFSYPSRRKPGITQGRPWPVDHN